MGGPQILPDDPFDEQLIRNVKPPQWTNPSPQGRYNLVVVGGGPAGLVCASGAAGLGARVALIERDLLGGDCLNVGCVPSKALVRSARAIVDARNAPELGVRVLGNAAVDFAEVMARMRRLRASLSPHDAAERFRSLGIDVFLGQGIFIGPDRVSVSGQELTFAKAVIATGAHAAMPPIAGLASVRCLTNENVFTLTSLPNRLTVIGGGPIGCELAQSFARFGSKVCLLTRTNGVLPREDPNAAKLVADSFRRDGIRIVGNAEILRIDQTATGKNVVIEVGSDGPQQIECDEILLGVGRVPNVDGLGLEAAGVEFDPRHGIRVNRRLQTTNPRVFAAGDVCSEYKFTHAADAMARIVLRNALFQGREKADSLVIPWCTFTDPEVARVGLDEKQASDRGMDIDVHVWSLEEVDRAILDDQTVGYFKVLTKKGTDRILGATIVASHAGEMISPITLAMTNRLGLRAIANTIFSYPTQSEGLKKVADSYNRSRLTPFVKWFFQKWLSWSR